MSFLEHFAELPDPPSDINRKYALLDIVFLTVTAILSGAGGWSDIEKFGKTKLPWLRKFRAFESGIPVNDTLARLIRAIEPTKMTECFINWGMRYVSIKDMSLSLLMGRHYVVVLKRSRRTP